MAGGEAELAAGVFREPDVLQLPNRVPKGEVEVVIHVLIEGSKGNLHSNRFAELTEGMNGFEADLGVGIGNGFGQHGEQVAHFAMSFINHANGSSTGSRFRAFQKLLKERVMKLVQGMHDP